MNKKRMAIMLAASGLVFGGVMGFVSFRDHMIKQYFATLPKPVIPVATSVAREEQWESVVPAVGTLTALNGVEVSASVAGLVREIAFESGQTVKRGDVLIRLDADVEMGELRSALAEADLARTSAQRSRALVKSDTVSQAALDKAESELKVREARVAALRAQIDKKAVHAPFDGVLGVRKVDLGQYLQPGQPIVNLQDLSVMLSDFSVSQKDLGAVAVGQPLKMTTDAWPGRVFTGAVAAIEPLVDAKTGMVAVQGRFPNSDGALRPGMFARIEIVRPVAGTVVTVPVEAVSYALHGDAVFVVKDAEDGKIVERVVVELGERRDGKVAVLNGLAAGDVVVTSGQVKLEHGSKVEIIQDDPLKISAKAD